jgi:hypothetical protein
VQSRRLAAFAVTVAVTVLVGCGGPSAPTTPSAPSAQNQDVPLSLAGLAKLDDPSRALLRQLDAGEWVTALLTVKDSASVRRLARQRGLGVDRGIDPRPDISVLGPPAAILDVAANPAVIVITLAEDDRALRPVAAVRPNAPALPQPGRPYIGRRLDVPQRRNGEIVPPERRQPLIAALAQAIVTIDGLPLRFMDASEGCDPPTQQCFVSIDGRREDVNLIASHDGWFVESSPEHGFRPVVTMDTTAAMPRWLERDAERIARSSNGDAPARIAAYARISAFRWTADPLRVDVFYSRPCAESGSALLVRARASDVQLADTGTCDDILDVTVDPASGTVTNVVQFTGN